MNHPSDSRSGSKSRAIAWGSAAILLLGCLLPATWALQSPLETPLESAGLEASPTLESVGRLDAATKALLQRRRERFEELSPCERERLSRLHSELASHENRDQLQQILVAYNRWLLTLTSIERAELADLPLDRRIERIKEIKRVQEEKTFERLAEKAVTRADIEHLNRWLRTTVVAREAGIREKLGPLAGRVLPRGPIPNADRERVLIGAAMGLQTKDLIEILQPEDFQAMRDGLSESASKVLEAETSPEEQVERVRRWLAADFWSRVRAGIPVEELEKFFSEELSDAERADLDQKSPEDRIERLRDLFLFRRLPRGGRGGGPPFGLGSGRPERPDRPASPPASDNSAPPKGTDPEPPSA